ncbi:MAG: hypothetical protein RPT25_13245 [Cycloclasticus sp.]|jgi:hypothetical protein
MKPLELSNGNKEERKCFEVFGSFLEAPIFFSGLNAATIESGPSDGHNRHPLTDNTSKKSGATIRTINNLQMGKS